MSERWTNWDELPLLLTPDEAATLLRLDVHEVEMLCASGQLRATRMGQQWRIRREDVLAFLR